MAIHRSRGDGPRRRAVRQPRPALRLPAAVRGGAARLGSPGPGKRRRVGCHRAGYGHVLLRPADAGAHGRRGLAHRSVTTSRSYPRP